MRSLWGQKVRTRDDVALTADIHLPSGPGPWPAVVMRTPYGRQRDLYLQQARSFAENGYAFVIQDVRGRHDSDGDWVPHVNEGRDGYDTIEWVAVQDWCTGRIGTIGASYGGWTQWAAAREKPPHLEVMSATASAGAWMEEVPYHDGVLWLRMFQWLNLNSDRTMQQNSAVDWTKAVWTLPLRDMDSAVGRSMPAWQKWLDHDKLDPYWQALRLDSDFDSIDLPVLHITGWHDGDQPGALYFYNGMMTSPAAGRQYLVVGPWDHDGARLPKRHVGGVDFGADAVIDHDALQLRWFDRWLKDGRDEPLQGCRYFVTGCNEWRDAPAWPPAHSSRELFLTGQNANTALGQGTLGDLASDVPGEESFVYDPANPVISNFDFNHYGAAKVPTPLERKFIEQRADVLVYTSEAFSEPLQLAGRPSVRLFVETDALDTDWFAILTVVDAAGRSTQLAAGRLRARFAGGLETERLLSPNTTHEVKIKMSALACNVRPGERLRLDITSSMFPDYARNLNTGGNIGDEHRPVIARNTVRHGKQTPSAIILPVIDGTASLDWPLQ